MCLSVKLRQMRADKNQRLLCVQVLLVLFSFQGFIVLMIPDFILCFKFQNNY